MMHWRDEYEIHADQARSAADATPIESLLEEIRQGRHGGYYGIRYSIADRANLLTERLGARDGSSGPHGANAVRS